MAVTVMPNRPAVLYRPVRLMIWPAMMLEPIMVDHHRHQDGAALRRGGADHALDEQRNEQDRAEHAHRHHHHGERSTTLTIAVLEQARAG